MLEQILEQLIPMRFLDPVGRARLVEEALIVEVPEGERIVRQGERSDRRVFLILEGHVELLDEAAGERMGTISKGRYFGERTALFDTPRALTVVAGLQCQLAILEQEVFLEALRQSPAMAQGFGRTLRDRQGLFRAFDAFMSELMHGVEQDVVNFRRLRHRYQALAPALHAHAQDPSTIDFEALHYVLGRLPEGIESTYMLYLTDNLDDHLMGPTEHFVPRQTRARRRAIYEMTPGKLMVLLRDGVSDLIDLVTCLCALAVEARKLRRRVQRPDRLDRLVRRVLEGPEPGEQPDEALEALGFEAAEREALAELWGDEVFDKLYTMALHHEDYNLQITKQIQGYNSQHAELWTDQIVEAVRGLVGSEPRALPPEYAVHIISSNTHSVQNSLSAFLRERADEIERWGRGACPDLFELDWFDGSDRLYALTRHWHRAHPEQAARRAEVERACGHVRLEGTALTGIGVDLIDVSCMEAERIDPSIPVEPLGPGLIVNIDYAFGQQAEEILALLLMLFGRNVRSVNILGKAGALVGQRGDVLIPTAFVEQTQDLLEPLPNPNAFQVEALADRLPGRQVHVGPVLTVAGTLLQNRTLLNFYRRIWQCTGLEMEGTYYLREILKAVHLGMIPEDVRMRFAYYVSDVPLAAGETLAGSLQVDEGVPPLYAITREILGGVLGELAEAAAPAGI